LTAALRATHAAERAPLLVAFAGVQAPCSSETLSGVTVISDG